MSNPKKLPRPAWPDSDQLEAEIQRVQESLATQELRHWTRQRLGQIGLSLAALVLAGCNYNPFVPKALYGGPQIQLQPSPQSPSVSPTPGSANKPPAPIYGGPPKNRPQPSPTLKPVPDTNRKLYGAPPRPQPQDQSPPPPSSKSQESSREVNPKPNIDKPRL